MKHKKFALRGFCPGGFVSGGFVRGVLSGGLCPGVFVLEPHKTNCPICGIPDPSMRRHADEFRQKYLIENSIHTVSKRKRFDLNWFEIF